MCAPRVPARSGRVGWSNAVPGLKLGRTLQINLSQIQFQAKAIHLQFHPMAKFDQAGAMGITEAPKGKSEARTL
jgi:hypothetical protein